MTREEIQKINLEDKCNLINALEKDYTFALSIIDKDNVQIDKKKQQSLEIYALIHSILTIMRSEQSEIIVNNFFQKKNSVWWENKYSSFEYKIKKTAAINKFAFYLLA